VQCTTRRADRDRHRQPGARSSAGRHHAARDADYGRAGLSPIDTIRAATINAQRVLGRDARSGTIEVGKDADLILLYADPLADIANLRRLKAVIQAASTWTRPRRSNRVLVARPR